MPKPVTRRRALVAALVTALAAAAGASAWRPWRERGADPSFDVSVREPALAAKRPRVVFDEGHREAHSARGRFGPFVELLRADGCRVVSSSGEITGSSLARCDALVIVNARGTSERGEDPAFTEAEIASVKQWVEGGGALLLVADHHPYGAAAASLANAFGVTMIGGWCDDESHPLKGTADSGAIAFSREAGMLGEHAILEGRSAAERVGVVGTFTGQSLVGPPGSSALLACAATAIDRVPKASQTVTEGGKQTTTFETADSPAAGHAQGLALRAGKGRVVVLGEAAMLSAQIDAKSGLKFGMNVPGVDNKQFALNVARWLAGVLE